MKYTTRKALLSAAGLLLLVGNALAAANGSVGLSSFTNGMSNPLDGLGDAKPIMVEVLLLVIGVFVVSCLLGVFGSGSVANAGNFLHNASLRSRGIMGIILVVGIIFAVIVSLILVFHFYNKYLVGM
jgi:amino acid transporter